MVTQQKRHKSSKTTLKIKIYIKHPQPQYQYIFPKHQDCPLKLILRHFHPKDDNFYISTNKNALKQVLQD